MLLSANADLRSAKKLAELGYDAIDVSFCRVIYRDDPYPHNPQLDDDDYERVLDRYMEECAGLGLKILTSHIPYRYAYNDPTSENYDYNFKMTCRSLAASEYLGAEWAVVHTKKAEDTVPYVKRLLQESGVKLIGIAIENMMHYPVEELIKSHDILKAEGYNVGVCFDTGHAHVNKHFDTDVAETVRLLGDRIKMLHVHDNLRNSDHHAAPFLGSIKWDSVMQALAEVGYTGALNLEVMSEKQPKELLEMYERYNVQAARLLISKFEQYSAK